MKTNEKTIDESLNLLICYRGFVKKVFKTTTSNIKMNLKRIRKAYNNEWGATFMDRKHASDYIKKTLITHAVMNLEIEIFWMSEKNKLFNLCCEAMDIEAETAGRSARANAIREVKEYFNKHKLPFKLLSYAERQGIESKYENKPFNSGHY